MEKILCECIDKIQEYQGRNISDLDKTSYQLKLGEAIGILKSMMCCGVYDDASVKTFQEQLNVLNSRVDNIFKEIKVQVPLTLQLHGFTLQFAVPNFTRGLGFCQMNVSLHDLFKKTKMV